MYISKKFLKTVCASLLISVLLVTTGYAEEALSLAEVDVTKAEDVGFQPINLDDIENTDLELLSKSSANVEPMELPDGVEVPPQTRSIQNTDTPVFKVNGNLDEAYDIYLTTLSNEQLVFFQLDSSNSDLIVLICKVSEDGTIDLSTGEGMRANSGYGYLTKSAGTYAIVVISNNDAGGDYTLYWNASNPTGAKYIFEVVSDLSRIVLFYNTNKICSNGTNILSDLKWEYHETKQIANGYTARDMAIKMYTAKAIYKGSFSSSVYSAPNALLVDVGSGSWLYSTTYYVNDSSGVTHKKNYYDPSGLKTPRTFGEGHSDNIGYNFIVIDLDKFQVCEFLSPFNYFYTEEGKRTYSLTNVVQYQ